MQKSVSKYLSTIGRRGGKKSRRILTPASAQEMVRIREARKAFKNFHSQCFWSYDSKYIIGRDDIDWVIEELRKNGGREAWNVGAKLCR